MDELRTSFVLICAVSSLLVQLKSTGVQLCWHHCKLHEKISEGRIFSLLLAVLKPLALHSTLHLWCSFFSSFCICRRHAFRRKTTHLICFHTFLLLLRINLHCPICSVQLLSASAHQTSWPLSHGTFHGWSSDLIQNTEDGMLHHIGIPDFTTFQTLHMLRSDLKNFTMSETECAPIGFSESAGISITASCSPSSFSAFLQRHQSHQKHPEEQAGGAQASCIPLTPRLEN